MSRESMTVGLSPPSSTTTATALAPGFRFHPTDEELVSYYLKRKVQNRPVRFDAIGEVDIYKHEPWDLAVFSRLKTRDQEWYFFSPLDKKYENSGRMNRATNIGYWKATGKDREIRHGIQLIGMKKTLVFHSGRAPGGLRTNWVMHEYRLSDYETKQDTYALCRVFHKNNIGPPTGNRYAPFMEEEWDDDGGGALIPGVDVRFSAVPLPVANGNNHMNQLGSKNLINLNEPPIETTPVDIQQNHHENGLKPQENNNYDEEEETLKHEEHAEEAPLPLIKYKRKRQNESNNSSRATHDHYSSSPTAINSAISALLEFSLMGISDTPPSSPTLASTEEKLNDLEKEFHQMFDERKPFNLEMMSAEAMISILLSRIDTLRQENIELRKNNFKRK